MRLVALLTTWSRNLAAALVLQAVPPAWAQDGLPDAPEHGEAQSPLAALESVAPTWLVQSQQVGKLRGTPSLTRTWRPLAGPDPFPGLKAIRRGTSVELTGTGSPLAVQAGKVVLPTSPEAGRPAYLVKDERPAGFLTAAAESNTGLQATWKLVRQVGVTVGAYNNKTSLKGDANLVRDALGRVDVDLGFAKGGGFYFYGTGRKPGDKTKTGFDLRTRLGPFELSGQVVHGVNTGAEQLGWYAAISQQLTSQITAVARVDQNRNLRKNPGAATHAVVALIQRLPRGRTLKLNYQVGIADTTGTAPAVGP
ncbi:MAG: hypothetical protein FJZ01_02260, partial [Candidatus Sericytochromatia bacterium]|nr:hypothetical protein [Candidatus Tanganyikabacteria bacterium]